MNFHEEIRVNYDRMSSYYDLLTTGEQRFTVEAMKLLDLIPGKKILEIGCGTGRAQNQMKKIGLRAVGLDLSFQMLMCANKLRISTQLDLCQADALYVPFRSASFDSVFMSFTLELFSDEEISILLTECNRLLNQNGSLIIVALARESTLTVTFYDWLHATWPKVIDCRPIDTRSVLIREGFVVEKWRRMRLWGLPIDIVRARQ